MIVQREVVQEHGYGRILNGTEGILSVSILLSAFSISTECQWLLDHMKTNDTRGSPIFNDSDLRTIKLQIRELEALHEDRLSVVYQMFKKRSNILRYTQTHKQKRSVFPNVVFDTAIWFTLNEIFSKQLRVKFLEKQNLEKAMSEKLETLLLNIRQTLSVFSEVQSNALQNLLLNRDFSRLTELINHLSALNVATATIHDIDVLENGTVKIDFLCQYFTLHGPLLKHLIPHDFGNGFWALNGERFFIQQIEVKECSNTDSLDFGYSCKKSNSDILDEKIVDRVACCIVKVYDTFDVVVVNRSDFPACLLSNPGSQYTKVRMDHPVKMRPTINLYMYIKYKDISSVDNITCTEFATIYPKLFQQNKENI